MSVQAIDADAWLGQLLADNTQARAAAIARAPKLPKPSYKTRRAEWAAMGKSGEDARLAMEAEMDREPYVKVQCDRAGCEVCGS